MSLRSINKNILFRLKSPMELMVVQLPALGWPGSNILTSELALSTKTTGMYLLLYPDNLQWSCTFNFKHYKVLSVRECSFCRLDLLSFAFTDIFILIFIRGNVGVVMFNHSEVEVSIKAGDRIAQLVCEKISYPEIQVDQLILILK